MIAVIFGSAGFIGLNLTEVLLGAGHAVIGFDRHAPPENAREAFSRLPGTYTALTGDAMDAGAVAAAIPQAADLVVLGVAVTAGPAREASEPALIVSVNLLAPLVVLEAAREAGVKRVINLSSAAAYGASGDRSELLTEDTPIDPLALYPITKFASERIGARVSALWGLDFLSVRLSGVFGPWEYDSGVRDTLSPHYQVLSALLAGRPALLPREGLRDWTYATDIAEAVMALAKTSTPRLSVYNITAGTRSSVLGWGEALARRLPGAVCRLALASETPTIDLFGPVDRAPMSAAALEADSGWRARFDLESAASDLARRLQAQGIAIQGDAP
jgi:UDP-glucose 4-epimerase